MHGVQKAAFDVDNWTTQLRKGLLELCVVNLLSQGELYGYDLVRRLADIRGLVVTEGTVYPLLSRLRRSGLVQTRLVESPDGPARRYYSLPKRNQATRRAMNTHWRDLAVSVQSLLGEEASGRSKRRTGRKRPG